MKTACDQKEVLGQPVDGAVDECCKEWWHHGFSNPAQAGKTVSFHN